MDWNRNYRILWSEARRAWVVTDEQAGTLGKGKSRGAAGTLVCAMLVAGGMLAAAPEASALSGSCGPGASTTITRALNGTCIAAPGDSITLSNTGSITGIPVSVGGSETGIRFGGSMNGTLINNGTIAALPIGRIGATLVTNGVAKGIKVAIDISGSLTNNGTVKVKASQLSTAAYATGIRAGGIVVGGTLSNTGAIQVTANGTGTTAMGIRVRNSMSGSLTNSGTVKVKAAKGGINVAGIGIGAMAAGSTLTNSGTVQMTVGKSGMGINVSGLSGSLTNSGKVLASANRPSSLTESVLGIKTAMNPGSSLTNSGTVTATVNNTQGTAKATGLSISNPMASSGGGTVSLPAASVVKATATAGSNKAASALGVFVGIPVPTGSTLTHSGLIQAKAKAPGSSANAHATGLSLNTIATVIGALSNAGTINATATGSASFGSLIARGVSLSTLSGTFTNSGTVTAKASSTGSFSAVSPRISGLLITTMNAGAVINNSGTISGTDSLPAKAASAYSLNVANSAGGVINNQTGGLLKGNILVNGPAQVNNAGTIEIPEQAQGSIANNYTQKAGGVLRIDASSLTSYGKLQVNGTADLRASGKLDVNVAAGSTLKAGDVLPGVLTAGTALNVPAGGLTVTDNSSTIDFQAVVNGNVVDLKVVAQAAGGGAGGGGTGGGGTGGGAAASGGGGGGCVLRPGTGGFDPVLPALAAGAWLLGLAGRRRPKRET